MELRGARARTTSASATTPPKKAYTPADIVDAYQLDTSRGAGQTIAIVDAYDNPKVEADLAVYRAQWGLPPCTTANGCFRKVNERGGSAPPHGDPGWGVEIALDVQAVSAACPRCKILLVEADTSFFNDIGRSVNTAVRLGADVVSNSYGGDEYGGSMKLGAKLLRAPGCRAGRVVGRLRLRPRPFPASWPSAVAAGGTSLSRTTAGWKEIAWWGSGSGCSAWVEKPSWQVDRHCPMRTVADLSAVADPYPGFAVYDTYGLGRHAGWIAVGGTRLSAPLLSGMIGLAATPRSSTRLGTSTGIGTGLPTSSVAPTGTAAATTCVAGRSATTRRPAGAVPAASPHCDVTRGPTASPPPTLLCPRRWPDPQSDPTQDPASVS